MSNTRTLSSAGYLHQVNTHDLGPGTTDVHWFDDQDLVGQGNSTDLDDAELNRQGDMLAVAARLRRGHAGPDGEGRRAGAGAAVPDVPHERGREDVEPVLGAGRPAARARRHASASRSPSEHPAADADCPSWAFKEFIAGGSEPDWGPADVNPQPRTTPTPRPTPVAGAGARCRGTKAGLSVARAKLKAALKSGLVVKVTGVSGTVKVTAGISKAVARKAKLGKKAMTVASGSAKAGADVRLKFTKRAAKRLAKLRSVTLTVKVAGGVSRTVTLEGVDSRRDGENGLASLPDREGIDET